MIFAGHVGQAVARAFGPCPSPGLAVRGPCPAGGTQATILSEDELAEAVEAAPPGLAAIFTHSHDLDHRLATPCGGDLGYVGLIGSATQGAVRGGSATTAWGTRPGLPHLPIGIAELKSRPA